VLRGADLNASIQEELGKGVFLAMVPLCSLCPLEELNKGVLACHDSRYCVFSPKVMRLAEKRVVFDMSVWDFSSLGNIVVLSI